MGVGGDERGVLQDLITDFFNIEKHDMCPILWRYTCLSVLLGLQDLISDFQLQGKHGLKPWIAIEVRAKAFWKEERKGKMNWWNTYIVGCSMYKIWTMVHITKQAPLVRPKLWADNGQWSVLPTGHTHMQWLGKPCQTHVWANDVSDPGGDMKWSYNC